MNNPAIVEQQKLIEARKRIENEMEKFRENERQYKSNKMTSSAMLDQMEKKGKFKFEDGEDDNSYGSDYDSDDSCRGSDEIDEEATVDDINTDKEWLQTFIKRDLQVIHSKYEGELNHIRNKKKGGAKKNKEKTQALVNKLADLKKVKERADELNITMDYLDPGKIKTLKDATKVFLKQDDDANTKKVLAEIDALIEITEAKQQAVLNKQKPGAEKQRIDDLKGSLIEKLDSSEVEDIVR